MEGKRGAGKRVEGRRVEGKSGEGRRMGRVKGGRGRSASCANKDVMDANGEEEEGN